MGRGRTPRKHTPRAVANAETEAGKLKISQAAHLVEKNSRTITKICQLLQLAESVADNSEKTSTLQSKIEHLKRRASRRLSKLATWAGNISISVDLYRISGLFRFQYRYFYRRAAQ